MLGSVMNIFGPGARWMTRTRLGLLNHHRLFLIFHKVKEKHGTITRFLILEYLKTKTKPRNGKKRDALSHCTVRNPNALSKSFLRMKNNPHLQWTTSV